MRKESIIAALQKLRESTKKRNFSQTIDFIINFKNFDIKKPANKVDAFIVLPRQLGKKLKICGLVDREMVTQAKETLDHVVTKDTFSSLKKQEIKKLARDYDFFIAQSTLMVEIAKFFGRVLGPKGKMPNPKSGCVIPPNANLKSLYEKLQKTVKVSTKNEASVKCKVGKDDMSNEDLAENIFAVYDNVVKSLPNEKGNIGKIMIKLTMSEAVEVKDE